MSRVRFASALAALLISTPLTAQSTRQSDSREDPVLVEGYRLHPETAVRETISGAGVIPLARFEDKICPGVVGLAATLAHASRNGVSSLMASSRPFVSRCELAS